MTTHRRAMAVGVPAGGGGNEAGAATRDVPGAGRPGGGCPGAGRPGGVGLEGRCPDRWDSAPEKLLRRPGVFLRDRRGDRGAPMG